MTYFLCDFTNKISTLQLAQVSTLGIAFMQLAYFLCYHRYVWYTDREVMCMRKAGLSIFEFQKRYRTEEDCEQAIIRMRWPKGFICSNCGHDDGYRLKSRRAIQCAVCRAQIAITAGTIFDRSKIPLLTWFWIIFLVVQDKGGASALRLSKQLGMCYSTVWHILHKIRAAMSKRDRRTIRLAGLIEMDEGFFGYSKHKTQFLVMIEAGNTKPGSLIMRKIMGSSACEADVKRVVVASVDNESQQHFVADKAGAHNVVKKMGHSLETHKSAPEAFRKLDWVHMAISLAKRFLLGTYHGAVSPKHLYKYLDEFCYRFNRRLNENQLCESLLHTCILVPPISYAAVSR